MGVCHLLASCNGRKVTGTESYSNIPEYFEATIKLEIPREQFFNLKVLKYLGIIRND
jgi:hypothetical protein